MHHHARLEGAAFVWLASAGVKARGEVRPASERDNHQVAATPAWLLGRDYLAVGDHRYL